jgi:integrase
MPNAIDAYPFIGNLPLKNITTEHIMQLLKPIWQTKTETATRVRNRINQILDYSLANKYHEGENVACWSGHLDKMFPKPSKLKTVKHHPALPYKNIHTFIIELKNHKTMSAYALEFLILTGSRTGSVINATWDEIDFEEKIWRVPAEKMKTKKPHEVPLNNRAMELITYLYQNKINDFVFVGQSKNGGLSNAAMDKLLQKTMGYPQYTVHGFRSCFRDWIGEETDTPNHVAEMALAHTIKNSAEAAYRRGDLLEKRRVLMNKWLKYINRPKPTDSGCSSYPL